MTAFSRIVLLILSVLLVTACGSADVAKEPPTATSHSSQDDSSPGTDGGTTTTPETPPDPETPPATPGDDAPTPEDPPVDGGTPPDPIGGGTDDPVVPPFIADLDTNIFFPIIDTMALYFDDNPVPVVLGESQTINNATVYPLEQGDVLREFVTSTADNVGLMGIRVKIMDANSPVYLDMKFAKERMILGDATVYSTPKNASASVHITGIPADFIFDVKLKATLAANEWITIPGFEPQPARKIHLTSQLVVPLAVKWEALLFFPAALPLIIAAEQDINLDLWLVPGIGLVKLQFADWTTQVQKMEGVPLPLVFAVPQNSNTNLIPAQAVVVEGQILTDNTWQHGIIYRTAGLDWLDVSYSAIGSWQARVIKSDLPKGIYAATVRYIKGNETRDVNVSMKIE